MGLSGLSGVSGAPGLMARKRFDTRALPGYVADFDVRYGVTDNGSGKCSQWDERWGNGMSFTQGTTGAMPTITANAFNGYSALTADGAATAMAGNTAAKSLIRNTAAYTIYAILRSDLGNGPFLAGTVAAGTRFYAGTGNGAYQMYGGGRVGDTGSAGAVVGPRGDLPWVYPFTQIVDHANSDAFLYRGNVLIGQNTSFLTAGSVPDAAALTTSIFSGASAYFKGDLLRFVVCNGAHTAQQQAAAWRGLLSGYGKLLLPCMNRTTGLLVQMMGDSITHSNALPIRTPTLPDRVWQALGSRSDEYVVNVGWSGGRSTDLSTRRPAYVDVCPLSVASSVVYVVYIGINDIAAGTSAATIYSNIAADVAAAKAARPGLKVVVCTPIACGTIDSTQRGRLVTLRDTILASAVTDGAAAVCDFGGLPEFLTSSTTLYNDTTYYTADKIHPSDGGNLKLAEALAATIRALP